MVHSGWRYPYEFGTMSLQLWTHARVATLAADAAQAYGLIDAAALVVDGGHLLWVGPESQIPAVLRERCNVVHDAGGAFDANSRQNGF